MVWLARLVLAAAGTLEVVWFSIVRLIRIYRSHQLLCMYVYWRFCTVYSGRDVQQLKVTILSISLTFSTESICTTLPFSCYEIPTTHWQLSGIVKKTRRLADNHENYVGREYFSKLQNVYAIDNRGVGNEQIWRTRFPDFSLISPWFHSKMTSYVVKVGGAGGLGRFPSLISRKSALISHDFNLIATDFSARCTRFLLLPTPRR